MEEAQKATLGPLTFLKNSSIYKFTILYILLQMERKS